MTAPQEKCCWVTKQLGQVLGTKRNQGGPRGSRAMSQKQTRQGQGLPLLSLGIWGEQEAESGQLFLMKTDVLWA